VIILLYYNIIFQKHIQEYKGNFLYKLININFLQYDKIQLFHYFKVIKWHDNKFEVMDNFMGGINEI